jgi:hypothetical protein
MEMVSDDMYDRENSECNWLKIDIWIFFWNLKIEGYFVNEMMLVEFFVLQSWREIEPVEWQVRIEGQTN